MSQPGDRVGAIFGGNKTFGEGIYEGLHPIGDGTGPEDPVGFMAELAREACGPEFENPRIRLDNGEVVWGCECWWGKVERYLQHLPADHVVVKPSEIRAKYREEQASGETPQD